jgi:hypothetical protein
MTERAIYFLDTEFMEDGRKIDLLSIGIVALDGRTFYAQLADADWSLASDWVTKNVLTHMQRCSSGLLKFDHRHKFDPCVAVDCPWRTRDELRDDLLKFFNPEEFGKPQIWTYYGAYDWVVLCQLFGPMIKLPKGWPMYSMDIKQLAVYLGDPQLPSQGKGEHHALADARWNQGAWEFLTNLKREGK